MPQLEFADWAPQLFWLALTFCTLYLLMAYVALPRIGAVIDARRGTISSDLAGAESLRRETAEAIAAYEQALAEARAKAQAMAQEARAKLKEEVDGERAKLEAQLAKKGAEAEARVQAAKVSALKELDTIAGDTAAEIVNTLIGVSPSKSEIGKAVQAARKGA
jgi:F-type H+-transporting ATPase subunit b